MPPPGSAPVEARLLAHCLELADAFESIGWHTANNRLEKSNDEHDMSHFVDAGTYPV